MKNMKIGRKLSVAFGVVIAFMVMVALLVGIMNTMSLTRVKEVAEAISVKDGILNVRGSFYEARINGRSIITRYSDAYYNTFTQQIDTAITEAQNFKTLVSSNPKYSGYVENAEEVIAGLQGYKSAMDSIKTDYYESQASKAKAVEMGGSMSEDFTQITEAAVKKIVSEHDNAAKVNTRTQKIMLVDEAYSQLLTVRAKGSVMFTFYDADTVEADMAAVKAAGDAVNKALESGKALSSDPVDIENFDSIISSMKTYMSSIETFVGEQKHIADLGVQAVSSGDEAIAAIKDLSSTINAETDADTDTAVALATTTLVAVLMVVIVTVIVSVVMMRILTNSIVPIVSFTENCCSAIGQQGQIVFPAESWSKSDKLLASQNDELTSMLSSITRMVRRFEGLGLQLQSIAGGDLTVDVHTLGADDLMGNSMKTMVDNLNAMFGDINNATAEVTSGAEQLSDGAQSLAEGSTEQAATVQQLTASIQDIQFKTKENSEMAKNTANLSNTVMENATSGTLLINDMTQAVSEINQASAEISKVIKVIDDIAFQTNILALNAAVEAARAGEAGKGFAVVADEVRNLASKSAAAAKETNALIENSVKKAEHGSEIAAKTSSAFAEIVEGVRNSVELINSISVSSDEQNAAIQQINVAIEQVSEVVQRNSATAEQSAASSEELNAQAGILSSNVVKFKLKK